MKQNRDDKKKKIQAIYYLQTKQYKV